MRTLAPVGRKIERLAEQQGEENVGVRIVAILSGQEPRPRRSDEELAKTAVGRLLLERRRRAELGYQD
jgi:hypothetical protein